MQEPGIELRWQTMVDRLVQAHPFRNPAIEAAFRSVPRHRFLPGAPLEQVYDYSLAIPTRRGERGEPTSSSSAPDIMGLMLDMLDLQPGQRVLEIGAGTGYNAALLAAITGPRGRVTSIDIQPDVVESARAHLAETGFPQVQVEVGDGGFGFAPGAPYDRIIVTACAAAIPPAWREQLVEGGRLVLPFEWLGVQNALAFERRGDALHALARTGCGFMPLQGAFSRAFPTQTPLGSSAGVFMVGFQDRDYAQDAENLLQWLAGPHPRIPTGLITGRDEILNRLLPWLLLDGQVDGAMLWASAEAAAAPPFPALIGLDGGWKAASAPAFFQAGAAALLARPPTPAAPPADPHPFELHILPLGPAQGAGRAAQSLLARVAAWSAARRPSVDWLSLRVLPAGMNHPPAPTETAIDTPWARLLVQVRPHPEAPR